MTSPIKEKYKIPWQYLIGVREHTESKKKKHPHWQNENQEKGVNKITKLYGNTYHKQRPCFGKEYDIFQKLTICEGGGPEEMRDKKH